MRPSLVRGTVVGGTTVVPRHQKAAAMSVPSCPSCRSPLRYGAAACPQCQLPVTGPLAARLRDVDQQLRELQARRVELLAELRGSVADTPAGPAVPQRAPAPERNRWSVQQLLLAGGVTLVLVAAVVFLAVTWSRIGVAGQVAVMVVVTVVSAATSLTLARRGLRTTAEFVGLMTLGLATLDAYAARALDLAGLATVDGAGYLAASAALISTGSALLARRPVTVRSYAYGVLLAAAVVPAATLEATSWPPATAAAGLAAAGLAFTAARGRAARSGTTGWFRGGPLSRLAGIVGGGHLVVALLVAVPTVYVDPVLGQGGLAALLVVGLAAAAGWRLQEPAGVPVAATLTAAALVGLGSHADLPGLTVLVLLAAVVAAGASLLHQRRIPGAVAAHVGRPSALLTAATGHLTAAVGLAAVAIEVSEPYPYRNLLLLAGLVLVLAGALAATAAAAREPIVRCLAAGGAALLAVLASLVATLEPTGTWTVTTVAAVTVASLLAAAVAARRRGHLEEPALLAGATTGLVLAVVLATGLSTVVPLASALGATGIAALAYALLPERGEVAVAGVLGCSAATWTLSADAGITVVEAYSLPLAALAGIVGAVHLLRRADAPSWMTAGPALSAGLLPSALATIGDPDLTRPLVVLAVASVVLAIGTRVRWQSPLVVGTLATVVVAVSQLAPYAQTMPRYLSLGTAGVLLLVLGARYEERRREAERAVAWVRALQ